MFEFDVFDLVSFARYRKDADKELDARAEEVQKHDEWMQEEFEDNPVEWQGEAFAEDVFTITHVRPRRTYPTAR